MKICLSMTKILAIAMLLSQPLFSGESPRDVLLTEQDLALYNDGEQYYVIDRPIVITGERTIDSKDLVVRDIHLGENGSITVAPNAVLNLQNIKLCRVKGSNLKIQDGGFVVLSGSVINFSGDYNFDSGRFCFYHNSAFVGVTHDNASHVNFNYRSGSHSVIFENSVLHLQCIRLNYYGSHALQEQEDEFPAPIKFKDKSAMLLLQDVELRAYSDWFMLKGSVQTRGLVTMAGEQANGNQCVAQLYWGNSKQEDNPTFYFGHQAYCFKNIADCMYTVLPQGRELIIFENGYQVAVCHADEQNKEFLLQNGGVQRPQNYVIGRCDLVSPTTDLSKRAGIYKDLGLA
ncbi:MAG: hypothetical protein H6679_05875 [Epsilonproteobacteria bacterium]|nr:hypothetical protein [Campylobacterota bacterium]